jgi:hypothetical protein
MTKPVGRKIQGITSVADRVSILVFPFLFIEEVLR